MQKNIQINLNMVESIKNFSAIAERTEADVKALSGDYVVNGKSIMGLFSLNLSEPVTIRVSHEDESVVNRFVFDIKKALCK